MAWFLFVLAATSPPANQEGPTWAAVTVLGTWAPAPPASVGSGCFQSSMGRRLRCQETPESKGTQPAETMRLFSREEAAIQVAFNADTERTLGQMVATRAQGNVLLFAQWVFLV